MDRRKFIAGSAALSAGAALPLPRDEANAFIIGFLIRLLLRTGIRRGLTRSAFGRAGLGSRFARRSGRSGSTRRQPSKTVRTGVGNRAMRNPNRKDSRREFISEIGLELGMQMVLPEDMGLDMPGVVGISKQRAQQYKRHNADALWITDMINSADVHVANLSSEKVIDLLDIELWSERKSDGPLASEPIPISARPDTETIIRGPRYQNVPTGPLELQANSRDDALLVSDYRGARIVGVKKYELIQEI